MGFDVLVVDPAFALDDRETLKDSEQFVDTIDVR